MRPDKSEKTMKQLKKTTAVIRNGLSLAGLLISLAMAVGHKPSLHTDALLAPDTITLNVDIRKTIGEMTPIWAFVGYDECNYTYLPDARKLLRDFADLSEGPIHVRAHNLLNTHEGPSIALKWGSTNVYTEDENGNPVYDWTMIDKIVDIWINLGIKPVMEIGFMPKALSTKPEPYRHHWSPGDPYSDIWTGWAYPPKDYDKWEELIFQWVCHSVERYGNEEVSGWWWQLWNEPDAGYWAGKDEEYHKLYDYTAKAIKRALPSARIGGPNVTGGLSPRQAKFLTDFLEHCRSGVNYATGGKGTPLDFISFHAKGAPTVTESGHVQMRMSTHMKQIDAAFRIIHSFPEFAKLPIIIGESDPEGCAACSANSGYVQMGYRNGTLFASYLASSFAKKYELADLHGVNLIGAVNWTFTFPGQPWFDGFRSFATNGINKPVFNVLRMFGLMGGQRIKVDQPLAYTVTEVMEKGVLERPDIYGMASIDGNTASILVWNYYDLDIERPSSVVTLNVNGLPTSRVLIHHYRIDETHSNAFTAWQEMGAPQQVTRTQYRELEAASELKLLTSPKRMNVRSGTAKVSFELPGQGISLIQLTW